MISILLATYNGKRFIEKSIESIIGQTFKDWELLIGFNGTIDGTQDIVKKYLSDERIKIFEYGDDKGKAKTLNKLIKETKYDWLAIQDDDDIWLPKKLEEQIKFVKEFDIIGTQIIYIDENENIIGAPKLEIEPDKILKKCKNGDNQIANTSAIFKKEKAIEVNGWDEKIDGIEDFDFWLKMMCHVSCKTINLSKHHMWHRVHSKSNFNTKNFDIQNLIKKYSNEK